MICICGQEIEAGGVLSGKIKVDNTEWTVRAKVVLADDDCEMGECISACKFCSASVLRAFLDKFCKEQGWDENEQ